MVAPVTRPVAVPCQQRVRDCFASSRRRQCACARTADVDQVDQKNVANLCAEVRSERKQGQSICVRACAASPPRMRVRLRCCSRTLLLRVSFRVAALVHESLRSVTQASLETSARVSSGSPTLGCRAISTTVVLVGRATQRSRKSLPRLHTQPISIAQSPHRTPFPTPPARPHRNQRSRLRCLSAFPFPSGNR